jgi:hypothetical protein
VPTEVRSRPNQLMFAAGSRHSPVVAPAGGRPGKNEQPRTVVGVHPHPPSRRRALGSPCTQIRLGDAAHSGLTAVHHVCRGRRLLMT